MTVVLKVDFTGRALCWGTTVQTAQKWVDDFPEVWSTGLLTVATTGPFYATATVGTLYIYAPDNVTPNTFAGLARQWTRDCIVVTKITQVAAAPDSAQEQANVNAQHQSLLDVLQEKAKAVLHDAELLVILAIVGVVLFLLWETGRLGKLSKGRK